MEPRRWLGLVSATVIAVIAVGCAAGTGPTDSEATPTPDREVSGASGEPQTAQRSTDSAAQPFDAIVADFVSPIGGESTRALMRITAWEAKERSRECGINAIFMSETDRYDQARFPDFTRIAAEGIGLLEANRAAAERPPETLPPQGSQPPPPVQAPRPSGDEGGPPDLPVMPQDPDTKCLIEAVPEFTAIDNVQGEWHSEVVAEQWASDDATSRISDAEACLRDRMGWSKSEFPALRAFFGVLDGKVTHLSGLSEQDRMERIATLDREATSAFSECGREFYDWFSDQLKLARPAFLERHQETIEAFSVVLDRRGYTP